LRAEGSGQGWHLAEVTTIDILQPTTAILRLRLHHETAAQPMQAMFDDVYLVRQEPCVPGGASLCIDRQPGDRRFAVDVAFATAQGGGVSGIGHPVDLTPVAVAHGGLFWFFDAANPELLVKVLDACDAFGRFWLFGAATTNVGIDLTVLDTVTGHVSFQASPDLLLAPPLVDTTTLRCQGS
jgi:hypothetical protein